MQNHQTDWKENCIACNEEEPGTFFIPGYHQHYTHQKAVKSSRQWEDKQTDK